MFSLIDASENFRCSNVKWIAVFCWMNIEHWAFKDIITATFNLFPIFVFFGNLYCFGPNNRYHEQCESMIRWTFESCPYFILETQNTIYWEADIYRLSGPIEFYRFEIYTTIHSFIQIQMYIPNIGIIYLTNNFTIQGLWALSVSPIQNRYNG